MKSFRYDSFLEAYAELGNRADAQFHPAMNKMRKCLSRFRDRREIEALRREVGGWERVMKEVGPNRALEERSVATGVRACRYRIPWLCSALNCS